MLELFGSLLWLESEIEDNPAQPDSEGKGLPRVPEWRARARATFRPSQAIATTLALRWDGKQFSQLDNSDGGRGGFGFVDDYIVLDARAQWQPWEPITPTFGTDNLTDER